MRDDPREPPLSPEILPHDLPAERALLGCLFREPATIATLDLDPADCYLQKNGDVLTAVLALAERREPVDVVTVAAELEGRDWLARAGGLSYLTELQAGVPHAGHVDRYARIVRETATLRRLVEAGGRVAALGYDRSRPLADVAMDAERALQQAIAGHVEPDEAAPLGSTFSALIDRITSGQAGVIGLETGYPDLDALTGGLQNSDLIILAARPSIGKTSMALSLGYHIAHVTCEPVGVFSQEMSRDQLDQRMLALHTGIDLQRLRTGNLRDDEQARAVRGMHELIGMPLYIDDTPGLSIASLTARARRMHARHGVRLLLIDYLQLLAGGGDEENRVQEVSRISRGLKALARELDIPVIALSQLSRAVEARQSKVPLLSDLRESGSIEQDADLVIFIYRDEVYDRETDKAGIAELHIAKHRNGPLGVVPLYFEKRTTRFHRLDRYRGPEGY